MAQRLSDDECAPSTLLKRQAERHEIEWARLNRNKKAKEKRQEIKAQKELLAKDLSSNRCGEYESRTINIHVEEFIRLKLFAEQKGLSLDEAIEFMIRNNTQHKSQHLLDGEIITTVIS